MPEEVVQTPAATNTQAEGAPSTPAKESPPTLINDKPLNESATSPNEKEKTKPTDTIDKTDPVVANEADKKAGVEPEAKDSSQKALDKYDLKLPEGSLLEAGYTEKVADFARRRGFSNDQAQAILERESELLHSYSQSQIHQLRQKSDEWVEQIKNDKEVGGEAFTQNVELANRVVHRFGSEALRKTLSESGLGNHPELVRVFAKIGKAMAPDQLVMPGTQAKRALSLEERLYPNHKKSEE